MSHKGFSHIGLSTLDLERTRDFYENVLKFKAVRCDTLRVKEGGQIRHIFFDAGRDQLIAFMEAPGCRTRSITSRSRRVPRRGSTRCATRSLPAASR